MQSQKAVTAYLKSEKSGSTGTGRLLHIGFELHQTRLNPAHFCD